MKAAVECVRHSGSSSSYLFHGLRNLSIQRILIAGIDSDEAVDAIFDEGKALTAML